MSTSNPTDSSKFKNLSTGENGNFKFCIGNETANNINGKKVARLQPCKGDRVIAVKQQISL